MFWFSIKILIYLFLAGGLIAWAFHIRKKYQMQLARFFQSCTKDEVQKFADELEYPDRMLACLREQYGKPCHHAVIPLKTPEDLSVFFQNVGNLFDQPLPPELSDRLSLLFQKIETDSLLAFRLQVSFQNQNEKMYLTLHSGEARSDIEGLPVRFPILTFFSSNRGLLDAMQTAGLKEQCSK